MVNIQTSGNLASEAAFEGAYQKRIAKRENEAVAKAYKQTQKTSVQERTRSAGADSCKSSDWKGEAY